MSLDQFTVRLITAGAIGKPVAEHTGASITSLLSTVGSLAIGYPASAVNAAEATLGREVAVLRNGVELPNCRFFLEEQSEDLTDDNEEAGLISLSGRSFLCALEDGIVYPQLWPTMDPPNHAFTNATPGTIMSTLIERAKTRGVTFRGLTYTFTSSVDSLGVAWSKALSVQYDAGVKLQDVMDNLVAQGICEVETVGRELRLYNPGTLERHLETGAAAIIFRKGRDVTDSPNKRSMRELGTLGLIGGAENQYVEYGDAGAVALYGRKERWFSQGGIADPATLTTVVQSEIERIKNPKLERTHGVVFDAEGTPQPFTAYRLGDWVGSDVGRGSIDAYRIRQINLTLDDQGMAVTGQVVLNDLFAEREANLSRRINGIINGTTITGASNGTSNPDDDTMPPKAPTSLTFGSIALLGFGQAQVTATWVKPTQNVDNTAYTDHANYEFQWKYYSDTAWPNGIQQVAEELYSFGPVDQNRALTVRVRAVDQSGNRGAWIEYTGATAVDDIPPPVPSQPILLADLGYLKVTWDGKGYAGQGMPADFRYVEVHASTTNNFTPVSTGGGATLVDVIADGQQTTLISVSYTATTYIKFVAVDATVNRSAGSAQSSGVASPVLSADIFDGAVGSAKLADAAIITAKIADATITDAKIANLSVAKLTAGTMTAAVILAGSIATATVGARVSMTSAGIRMFDAGSVERVNILTNGNATFSGYLQATQILGKVSAIDSGTGQRVDISPGDYFGRPNIAMSTGRAVEAAPAGWTMGHDNGLRMLLTYMYAPSVALMASGVQYNTATIFQMETRPNDGDFINGTTLPTQVGGNARIIFPIPIVDSGGILRYSPQFTWTSDGIASPSNADRGRYPMMTWRNSFQNYISLRMAFLNDDTGSEPQLRVTSDNGTTWRSIAASAFIVNSDEASKTGITTIPWKALDVIKDNPSKLWRYKENPDFARVGPMANNLPGEVTFGAKKSVDISSMIGLLWKALEEVQEEQWLKNKLKLLGLILK